MSAVVERLNYTDLESELHEAVNMAEVACQLIEDAGAELHGDILVTKHEWDLLLFAVFHSSNLAQKMKQRWEEIHASNVAAKGGAQ